MQELYCFLPCLAFLDASLLVMIEEFAMIWPNLVENYVFVAVNLGNNTSLYVYEPLAFLKTHKFALRICLKHHYFITILNIIMAITSISVHKCSNDDN
jgi:hypothetical protein